MKKAYPKDKFPLPSIDMLIDTNNGHCMFSFMDSFRGYNQIIMDPADVEKTVFRIPMGNFYYTVMLFGSKTLMLLTNEPRLSFHDRLQNYLEDYIDDVVVKTKKTTSI